MARDAARSAPRTNGIGTDSKEHFVKCTSDIPGPDR
jgi:hypothetical protein